MKKYLHPKYLPVLVPIISVLGLLLRLWTMGSGPDAEGLYAPQTVAWVLLWLVSGITVGGIALISSGLKNPGRYPDNFPASIVGAIGCAAGAVAAGYTGFNVITGSADLLALLTGILGIVSAGALALTALARFQGKQPNFLLHLIPCLFLALRVFDCCKHWSNLTQSGTFLFQFFASICIMLAAYQLCCFDVNLGNRKSSLLWSLSGFYFCILAMPMGEDPVFYAGMAIWLITNLCSARLLKTAAPQPAAPEAPVTESSSAVEENISYDELMNWLDKE